MEHKINKIYQDIKLLTQEDWEHIQNCEICLQEYKIANLIEQAIEDLPNITVPINTETILIKTMYTTQNVYGYYLSFLLVILSIPSLAFFTKFNNLIDFLPVYFFLYSNLFSIFLFLILITSFCIHFIIIHRERLELYSEKFDSFLQKKIMNFL